MTEFFKLSGAGNDFLALVEPEDEPRPEAIRAWCARGLSIGADGLFTLARESDGAARMIHYNADGGRAELCVNGTRCAARLAFHLAWAKAQIVVRTDSCEVVARPAGQSEIQIEIPAPVGEPEPRTLELGDRSVDGWFVRVGVPHLVLAWDGSLADAPVAELGPPLRAHPALGDDGANVHWVRYAESRRFGIRSFERGVDAETLACGSGVLAAVAVGRSLDRLDLPAEALPAGGFVLSIDARSTTTWTLTGDARLLARGELLPESDQLAEVDLDDGRARASGE